VLREVGCHHRAEHGVNWATLEVMAGKLFGDAPEIHAGEGGLP
jgi:hypothetical protein